MVFIADVCTGGQYCHFDHGYDRFRQRFLVKDGGFAVGLIFLSIIFMAILAFGEAKYLGPVVAV